MKRRALLIVVGVISSWLMAIAVLLTLLKCLPILPGNLPDHLE